MKKSVNLKLHAEKKHSVRYDFEGGASGTKPLITSIYISKTHLPTPFPESIMVTVETSVADGMLP